MAIDEIYGGIYSPLEKENFIMRPKLGRIFYLTLLFFLLVWAFSTIDQIGIPHKASDLASLASRDVERQITAVLGSSDLLSESGTIQSQVDAIDRQIEELQGMKKGFEARALRHEDQAQRLQFEDRAILETRRHIELADENRAKAERVQEEIDRLATEKQRLLQSRK
jgi:hypothetical protein